MESVGSSWPCRECFTCVGEEWLLVESLRGSHGDGRLKAAGPWRLDTGSCETACRHASSCVASKTPCAHAQRETSRNKACTTQNNGEYPVFCVPRLSPCNTQNNGEYQTGAPKLNRANASTVCTPRCQCGSVFQVKQNSWVEHRLSYQAFHGSQHLVRDPAISTAEAEGIGLLSISSLRRGSRSDYRFIDLLLRSQHSVDLALHCFHLDRHGG